MIVRLIPTVILRFKDFNRYASASVSYTLGDWTLTRLIRSKQSGTLGERSPSILVPRPVFIAIEQPRLHILIRKTQSHNSVCVVQINEVTRSPIISMKLIAKHFTAAILRSIKTIPQN
jgi:hypothetical protein